MYKRLLIKLSGEALGGPQKDKYDARFMDQLLDDVCALQKQGIQIAIVMGAGNILRGNQVHNIPQALADQMGMLGTIMNGLMLQELFVQKKAPVTLMSVIDCPQVCQPYNIQKAQDHLSKGDIVLCAGGTGAPFFTTDTAASLRARELQCDVIMKGTKVDGVFSKDPEKHQDATHYETLSYDDILDQKLGVMDLTAATLSKESGIPTLVFSIFHDNPFSRALSGDLQTTYISA